MLLNHFPYSQAGSLESSAADDGTIKIALIIEENVMIKAGASQCMMVSPQAIAAMPDKKIEYRYSEKMLGRCWLNGKAVCRRRL